MALAERIFLHRVQGRFWSFTLRDIVGGVLLGIVMALVQQVTDRGDAALTGGSFVILGSISFNTLLLISAIFFRFPGVLITGLVQAAISTATAASPMSPAFIWTDIIQSVAAGALVWQLSMRSWWHWPVLSFGALFVGMIGISAGLAFILQLPSNVILISFLVTWIIGSAVSAPLTAVIAKGIDNSGVLD